MKVSVAICTWNRSDLLFQTLQRLKRLTIPTGVDWELIVVDNASTDATAATIDQFYNDLPIRAIYQPIPGHSRSRNAAIEVAQGELILWTDNDVWVDSNWLAAYVAAAQANSAAAYFGGKIAPRFLSPQPRWLAETWGKCHPVYATRDLGDDPFRLSPGQFPFGANFAVRTAVQKQYRFNVSLGRSQAGMLGDDEIEMMARLNAAGHHGIWVPQAKVEHLIPDDRATPDYVSRYFVGQGIANLKKGKPTMKSSGHARRVALFNQLCFLFKQHRSTSDEWVSHLIRASIARGESVGYQQRTERAISQSKHRKQRVPSAFAKIENQHPNHPLASQRPLVLLVSDVPFWNRQTGAQQRIASLTDWLDRQPVTLLRCYTGSLENQITNPSLNAAKCDSPATNLISLVDDWRPIGWWERLRWQGACVINAVARRQKGQVPFQTDSPKRSSKLTDFASGELRRRFLHLIKEIQPDFVIVEYATLGYLVPSTRVKNRPRFILDTHDILSGRNQQFKENKFEHWIDINWDQEVAMWSRFDALMAIQAIEGAKIHATLKPHQTLIVAGHPAFSTQINRPTSTKGERHESYRSRQSPITIGLIASANAANIDGARWLIDEIWPLVCQRLATDHKDDLNPGQTNWADSIRLWIVGPLCHQLNQQVLHQTIELQDSIDGLDEFYQRIDIAINPVRLGSGLKIKNIEALAHAKPLITTGHSAQGLTAYRCLKRGRTDCHQTQALFQAEPQAPGSDSANLLTVDSLGGILPRIGQPWIEFETPQQAAVAIVSLVTDSQLRNRLSGQAMEFAHQQLSTDVVFRELSEYLELEFDQPS